MIRMKRIGNLAVTLGGIMVIAGAMLRITGKDIAVWIYMAGAVLFLICQLCDRYDGDSVTIRRLRGQQIVGAVFLVLSAVLMYAERWRPEILMNHDMNASLHSFLVGLTARNSWIVFMCISALFELYSSFRLEHESKKEE